MANNPVDGGKTDAASPARDLTRALAAEALGAGMLAFCVVAAGILGERFAGGNTAITMLATCISGAAVFMALGLVLFREAPHAFSPAMALAAVLEARVPLVAALLAAVVQGAAAVLGVMMAHLVTNTGLVQTATQIQTGPGIWAGEFAAAAVFVFVAQAARAQVLVPWVTALMGGLVLLAVSLAVPSMPFVSPALTLARTLTDSFTAIRTEDAACIAVCQFVGASAGVLLSRWFFARETG